MRRAALLTTAYWSIAFASYEVALQLARQTEARNVYAILTTQVALASFAVTTPLRSADLMMLFVAAAIAATSALVGGLLPLHDVDAGPSSLEWLDFLLPWLLMLFAPIAVGAGLRRAFACK